MEKQHVFRWKTGIDSGKSSPYCPARLKVRGADGNAPPEADRPHGCDAGASGSDSHVFVQSLPETVQVLRPPGTWTVPGAFVFRPPVFSGPPGPTPRLRVYNSRMTTPSVQPAAARIIRGLMIAIVVWGAIIAAGAWTLNHDVRRPLVVMACVLGFLGFWLAMLRTLRRPM